MPELPLTGGGVPVRCGPLRGTEPCSPASYCHCTRCQRRTGTGAAASARVAPGSFQVLAGEESIGIYVPPDGFHTRAFCRSCGSAL